MLKVKLLFLALSGTLYVLSLFEVVFKHPGAAGVWYGYEVLLYGWLGFFNLLNMNDQTYFMCFGWLANPLYFLVCWQIADKKTSSGVHKEEYVLPIFLMLLSLLPLWYLGKHYFTVHPNYFLRAVELSFQVSFSYLMWLSAIIIVSVFSIYEQAWFEHRLKQGGDLAKKINRSEQIQWSDVKKALLKKRMTSSFEQLIFVLLLLFSVFMFWTTGYLEKALIGFGFR